MTSFMRVSQVGSQLKTFLPHLRECLYFCLGKIPQLWTPRATCEQGMGLQRCCSERGALGIFLEIIENTDVSDMYVNIIVAILMAIIIGIYWTLTEDQVLRALYTWCHLCLWPCEEALLLSLFCRWRNWGLEASNNSKISRFQSRSAEHQSPWL